MVCGRVSMWPPVRNLADVQADQQAGEGHRPQFQHRHQQVVGPAAEDRCGGKKRRHRHAVAPQQPIEHRGVAQRVQQNLPIGGQPHQHHRRRHQRGPAQRRHPQARLDPGGAGKGQRQRHRQPRVVQDEGRSQGQRRQHAHRRRTQRRLHAGAVAMAGDLHRRRQVQHRRRHRRRRPGRAASLVPIGRGQQHRQRRRRRGRPHPRPPRPPQQGEAATRQHRGEGGDHREVGAGVAMGPQDGQRQRQRQGRRPHRVEGLVAAAEQQHSGGQDESGHRCRRPEIVGLRQQGNEGCGADQHRPHQHPRPPVLDHPRQQRHLGKAAAQGPRRRRHHQQISAHHPGTAHARTGHLPQPGHQPQR